MSQYIQNEIHRLKTKKTHKINNLQREIILAESYYDSQIKELISKCNHKEALSRRFDLPMGHCEFCETDMTKPIGL